MFYSMGDYVGTVVGFGSQLRHLVDALPMSLDVLFMEDFVSGMRLTYPFGSVRFFN